MRELKFQAKGPGFQPSRVNLPFSHAFAPGSMATFGGWQGSIANFGAALYVVPVNLPASPGESDLTAALKHLASLLPLFQAAGADEFVLHLHRQYEVHCNEEFTRRELALLSSLGCHLFYQAQHTTTQV